MEKFKSEFNDNLYKDKNGNLRGINKVKNSWDDELN
jgi:hypothetical protein